MVRIVIPNRTRRWFHDWNTHHEVRNAGTEPIPFEGLPSFIYGIPACIGSGYRRTLTGLQEQLGVSIPLTIGYYLGIPRTIHISDQLPQGRVDFIALRRENESKEEWGRRCTTITSIGAPRRA